MKISVIIPTYKRPQLLLKCLAQLAQQNFFRGNYEVIVITDGEDIETKTVVESFSRQQLFLNLFCYSVKEKKGPAAARNKGAEYANAELLVFTDDDCLPQREWLYEYWKAYEDAHKKEVAFTGKTIVPYTSTPTDYEKNISNLQTAEFITANCSISRSAFYKVNGFDEKFSAAWREDSDLHFRLIKSKIPIQKINNAVVVHPVRKTAWGVSIKEQKKSLFNALLYKKHNALYKQKINGAPLFNYYIMIFVFSLGVIGISNGFKTMASVCFFVWLALIIEFTWRRLKATSKTINHVVEMIITSAVIPFLSVFWTLYGSFKYKTFFL